MCGKSGAWCLSLGRMRQRVFPRLSKCPIVMMSLPLKTADLSPLWIHGGPPQRHFSAPTRLPKPLNQPPPPHTPQKQKSQMSTGCPLGGSQACVCGMWRCWPSRQTAFAIHPPTPILGVPTAFLAFPSPPSPPHFFFNAPFRKIYPPPQPLLAVSF